MWITQTPEGKYKYVERYIDPATGKRRSVSTTLTKKDSKSRNLATLILQEKIEKRTQVTDKEISVKELAEKWYEVYEQTVKASTSFNVKTRLTKMLETLGDLKTRSNLIQPINSYFLDALTNRNLKYRTVMNDKSIIIRILNFGIRYGFVKNENYNLLISVPEINLSKKNHKKYLEPDEIKMLVEQLQTNYQFELARMCLMQIQTGMRYNEMVALDYNQDIDLENKIIHVHKNYDHENNVFTSTKTDEARFIHINDETAALIKEQIEYDKVKMVRYNLDRKQTLLFRQKNGKPRHIRATNRLLQKIKIPGKKVSTHYFRHTFITLMVQNKIDSPLIAQHVGNSPKMVDEVYSHFTKVMDNELKKAVENFKTASFLLPKVENTENEDSALN